MKYDEVTEAHPSANGATPTRNVNAERGVGRAFRHETDMLPVTKANITRQKRPWGQTAAFEENKGVLAKSRPVDVLVKSSNNDAAAVGTNAINWGIAGTPDKGPVLVDTPPNKTGGLIVAGIALLATFFLIRKMK